MQVKGMEDDQAVGEPLWLGCCPGLSDGEILAPGPFHLPRPPV